MKKTAILLMTICIFSGCGEKDVTPPTVVSTNPQNGSIDVDPSLSQITVTFDEEMMDGCSWCMENKETFPEITGTPNYTEGNTKNILPVKLLPGKEYVIWINTNSYTNFKDKAGNPVTPYKLTFKTK